MSRNLNILLIDDDVIELMKFKRVLERLKLDHNVAECNNGVEALNYLKISIPDIIILDLNMPKINGKEFLIKLANNKSLRHIPTIILSTSNNKKDLLECYKIGVSGYIVKPLKYEDYVLKIEKVLSYWSINELIKK
jgi:CheY-like chemotaxis protein